MDMVARRGANQDVPPEALPMFNVVRIMIFNRIKTSMV
jgi:hypothetical protein